MISRGHRERERWKGGWNVLRACVVGFVLLALSPARTVAADPLTIDVMLPITGAAAFSGTSQQQAVQIYERLVNRSGGIHGRPVHFEIHDDQSNPVIAVQIVNELLPKKPVVILGPSVAATCSAIFPLLAGGNGPVDYCFSPVAEPPRGSFVFAISRSVESLIADEAVHLREAGYKRLALLSATDASGQLDTKYFLEALRQPANAPLALVEQQQFAPADLGIAAQVAKIKAAQPDVVVVYAIGPAFWMSMRELKGAGLDVAVMTNPANADDELIKRYETILPKTLIVAGLPYQAKNPPRGVRNASAEYLSAFREAGLKPPSRSQGDAWDPMRIVVAALRALPTTATPAQLHDYIENLHDFPGLFGIYDFRSHDQHGLPENTINDEPDVRWDGARGEWVYFGT
jgi:branched-chain amino acid transport system substrate-binding protein